VKFLRNLWDWLFDGEPGESVHRNKAIGEAKTSVWLVIGVIVILSIIFFVIWVDNYIRYHF
jgi:hypothetical protein